MRDICDDARVVADGAEDDKEALMDPNGALHMIVGAERVDAETREVMRGLHQWLSRSGFAPDWDEYPTGTRRYRKVLGRARDNPELLECAAHYLRHSDLSGILSPWKIGEVLHA